MRTLGLIAIAITGALMSVLWAQSVDQSAALGKLTCLEVDVRVSDNGLDLTDQEVRSELVKALQAAAPDLKVADSCDAALNVTVDILNDRLEGGNQEHFSAMADVALVRAARILATNKLTAVTVWSRRSHYINIRQRLRYDLIALVREWPVALAADSQRSGK